MSLKNLRERSNSECMDYLAAKIRAERHRLKLTQKEFALLANIPLRTYKRFEQNCSGNFQSFINVLRAFDKLVFLETIFVESLAEHRANMFDKIESARKKSLSRDQRDTFS